MCTMSSIHLSTKEVKYICTLHAIHYICIFLCKIMPYDIIYVTLKMNLI